MNERYELLLTIAVRLLVILVVRLAERGAVSLTLHDRKVVDAAQLSLGARTESED